MEKNRKKEILREYKERKRQEGIFAIRCAATGQAWIGSTRNLDKQKNAIWFQLRMGKHPNGSLLKAWNEAGEPAFTYEIVEEVTDENPLLIGSLLKERATYWREALPGQPLI